MENYEYVKKLGSGNFGVISLMRHKHTTEMVAVKRLEVCSPSALCRSHPSVRKVLYLSFVLFK